MFIALIVGLITGFLISIPVGPINVAVVNTFIKHDFKSAIAIAIGGSLMDFVYFIVFLSGLSLFDFSPRTTLTLKIMGVVFLLIFGVRDVLVKKEYFKQDPGLEKKAPSLLGFFLLGVVIYSSNPTLLATMSGLAALMRSWSLFASDFNNNFMLSFGLGIGSACWSYLILVVVRKHRNRIPDSFFINFSRSCGVLIILLSLYMAFSVYMENFV